MSINKLFIQILFLLLVVNTYAQTNVSINSFSYEELNDLIKSTDNVYKKDFYYKLFLKKAKKENNEESIIKGFKRLSENAYNIKNAIKYLDSTSKYAGKSEYYSMASFYFQKGWVYSKYRNEDKAIDNFVKSLKCINKKKEEKLYYKLKLNIVIIKSGQQDYTDAIKEFKECETYFQKTDTTGQYYLCSIYGLAENYNRQRNIDKADFYTKKGLSITRQIKNQELINRFLCCDGINDFARKEYVSSISKLKTTLPILKNLNQDFLNYSINCNIIGKSYLGLKDTKNALIYFSKVDSIFQKNKVFFPENLDVYNNLIKYYETNGNIQKQLYYTKQLIKADNCVHTKYKYLTNKIHKEYDIAKLQESELNLIEELNYKKAYLYVGLLILFLSILFGFIYFKRYNKKQLLVVTELKKNHEEFILKQKELFEKKNKEAFLLQNIDNKSTSIEISDTVRNDILKKLKVFEKELGFTNKKCNLENLSKELETNSTYLSKIINDKKQCNFSTYLNNLRIEHTIYLLENNKKVRSLTIAAISELVGYNSVKPFITAFKERYSILPSIYLKKFN